MSSTPNWNDYHFSAVICPTCGEDIAIQRCDCIDDRDMESEEEEY